jgi:hypothetical protein
MPAIGRRRFVGICVPGAALAAALFARPAQAHEPAPRQPKRPGAAEEETPFSRLAKLAAYLSQNSTPEALACFDPGMKDYALIEANIGAIGAQTDVLCAIDVLEEKGERDERKLDTDWFVELRSQADGGPVERRRERVQIEMKKLPSAWKIISMAPASILDPIHIH